MLYSVSLNIQYPFYDSNSSSTLIRFANLMVIMQLNYLELLIYLCE